MELLTALQAWYSSQCNGEWEHQHGIQIDSCDNPGWRVKIDLIDTPLQLTSFDTVVENVDSNGLPVGTLWLHCYVQGNVWIGAGDETKLTRITQVFLDWATRHSA